MTAPEITALAALVIVFVLACSLVGPWVDRLVQSKKPRR